MPIPYLLCKNGIGCLLTMPDGAPSEEYGRVQKAFIAATRKKDDIDWCDMIHLWPHQRHANGIYWDEWLVNCNGAGFNILAMPDNTPEQIEEVKNQIRRDHDVVTLRITRIKKLITLP